MPRPLTKPYLVKLRLTEEKHALAVALANGQPLGPALVSAALARTNDAWGSLEAEVLRATNRSPLRAQAVAQLAALRATVRDA